MSSIVAAYDKTLFYNEAGKYCVLRLKTADPMVPENARDKYKFADHLIRFVAVGYDLPRTDKIRLELDGKWVLLTSPQDMLPQGFEYHNGNGTLCMVGDYNEEDGTFIEMHNQSVDYGIDFYAPQTVLAPDGRRIMIGWMQNWDSCS